MAKFKRHIFVCTNQRAADSPRGSCDPAGNQELHKAFKSAVSKRGLKYEVRANKCGCLNQCEHGPSVVVYPEAVWYGHVSVADVEEIIEKHIVGGEPVSRLVLPDECVNTETCDHKPKKR